MRIAKNRGTRPVNAIPVLPDGRGAESAPPARPRLAYVIPHLSPVGSEHFAHVPRLLAALGERVDVAAVIERGTCPPQLPGVGALLRVPGGSRAGRLLGTVRTVHWCARAGYRTYFLRYSRLYLAILIATWPLYRHRILLWRSGTADLVEPGHERSLRRLADHAVNWILARFVHRFVTGPETMVRVMSRRWQIPDRKMRLLYNDIDADRFRALSAEQRRDARRALGWADGAFVVLFVHRLSFRRGTRLLAPLLDAVSAALDVEVRLVVAGDGPDRGLLQGQAQSPTRRGRMDVLGAVPNRDLPAMYAAADCLLMPSYEEGFPRVLLEAMAAGTPIVTTDAGGSADVVGPGYPHLVAVGDLDGLIRQVLLLAATPDGERRELGRRLRTRAQCEFSPHRVAAMLEQILREEDSDPDGGSPTVVPATVLVAQGVR